MTGGEKKEGRSKGTRKGGLRDTERMTPEMPTGGILWQSPWRTEGFLPKKIVTVEFGMAETKTCTESCKTSMVSQRRSDERGEILFLKMRSKDPEVRTVKVSGGKTAPSQGTGAEDIRAIRVMTTGIRTVLRDDGRSLADTLNILETPRETRTGGEKSLRDKDDPDDRCTRLTSLPTSFYTDGFYRELCIKDLFVSVYFEDVFFLTCFIIDVSQSPL